MKSLHIVVAGVGALFVAGSAFAQMSDKPWEENWAPTKWGADDRAGSANHVHNSANIKRAMSVVKQFKALTIGKFYHREAPAFGVRGWQMTIPGTPTGGPFGKNALVYHDELVTTELGQIQTQFDGPGHIGVRTSKGDFYYNGQDREKAYEHGPGGRVVGMGPLGVENTGDGFVCRSILLDAVAYRKSQGSLPADAEMLPIPKKAGDIGIITADDVKGMIKAQHLGDIQSGDCVFLHTGQGNSWGNDRYKKQTSAQHAEARALFAQGEPGFGISACQYMATKDIALTGGDTSANDAQPGGEEEGFAVPCHSELQTRRGIWNIENIDTNTLVAAKVQEFAFVWAPLRMIGATGSPGNPVALY